MIKMAKIEYEPQGICPRLLRFEVEDNKLKGFQALGGCNGNLKAVSKLCDGMTVEEIESKLLGNQCGMRGTSCADQFAKAVREALETTK